MAIAALLNVVLVLFNISYVPVRDVYLRYFPAIANLYDPVKQIEVHPITQHYLNTVESLDQSIASVGLGNPTTKALLSDLRQQSDALIDEDPFAASGKFGTFAKLKRRIRDYTGAETAKQALMKFWSEDFLSQSGWASSLSFFDQQLSPLLQRNYYRAINENGQFEDDFWKLDLAFIGIFAVDIVTRTFWISRQQPTLSWLDAMLRRWYDLFLLLPFWRWLRLLPTTIRLHQSGLVNMEHGLSQVTHEPAAYLADRVTSFVLVRLINQTKASISEGDLARSLLGTASPYIQVSSGNKVDAIVDRLLDLAVYKALPQVQPDLEALLRHSLKRAVEQSNVYQGLQQFPGLDTLPKETTESFADYLAHTAYGTLVSSYSDVEGRQLFEQLSDHFREALFQELRDRATQQELETLLADLLEELKLNYVQRSAEHDPEETLEEADQLYQSSEVSNLE